MPYPSSQASITNSGTYRFLSIPYALRSFFRSSASTISNASAIRDRRIPCSRCLRLAILSILRLQIPALRILTLAFSADSLALQSYPKYAFGKQHLQQLSPSLREVFFPLCFTVMTPSYSPPSGALKNRLDGNPARATVQGQPQAGRI